MASLYIIVDTKHPLWYTIKQGLENMRKSCNPVYNRAGDKAIVQLKDGDEIPSWSINFILNKEGVYGAGDHDWLCQQDLSEWSENGGKKDADNTTTEVLVSDSLT